MGKTGFTFYRAETDRFQDIKIKRLKKRYHATGYAVYQYILNEIYRVEGCYLDFGEDEAFEVADYWGINEDEVQAITTFCCEIGLFDTAMFDAYGVLTARSIQTRYVDMCKLSKRKATIPEQYILFAPEQEASTPQNAPQSMPQSTPQPAPQSTPTEANNRPSASVAAAIASPVPQVAQAPLVCPAPIFPKKTGETPNNSGKNEKFPEKTGKTPEKSDRREKSITEREKNIPPPTPQEEEEILSLARRQLSQLQANETAAEAERRATTSAGGGGGGSEPIRNTPGLLLNLEQYRLTKEEIVEVMELSNYGEIGGQVWQIINHIRNNAKAIKAPRFFLLAKLRGACSA